MRKRSWASISRVFIRPRKSSAARRSASWRWRPPRGRFEDEGWRLRKDGSFFWANVVITPVRDAAGELLGFAKVTRDLTERRQTTQRLEASEARLQAFMNHSHSLMFIKDLDGPLLVRQ